MLDTIQAGTFAGLQTIHKYLFGELCDFADKLCTVNIAKGNFRFAPAMYLEKAFANIDISDIAKEHAKGNLVGFIGGPPCPDFSVAGKNAGSTGENGRLTKVYFDIICRCRPDFFLFENVKGLVKTEKHRTFYDEMMIKIQANDYVISEKICNALAYGVPQFRERVFMIGLRKDICGKKIDNFQFDWDRYRIFDTEKVLKRRWPQESRFVVDGSCALPRKEIPRRLTVEYWFKKNDVANHINGNDIFRVKRGYQKIASIPEGDTSRKSFKRLHRWRYSPTAAYGHNEYQFVFAQ